MLRSSSSRPRTRARGSRSRGCPTLPTVDDCTAVRRGRGHVIVPGRAPKRPRVRGPLDSQRPDAGSMRMPTKHRRVAKSAKASNPSPRRASNPTPPGVGACVNAGRLPRRKRAGARKDTPGGPRPAARASERRARAAGVEPAEVEQTPARRTRGCQRPSRWSALPGDRRRRPDRAVPDGGLPGTGLRGRPRKPRRPAPPRGPPGCRAHRRAPRYRTQASAGGPQLLWMRSRIPLMKRLDSCVLNFFATRAPR